MENSKEVKPNTQSAISNKLFYLLFFLAEISIIIPACYWFFSFKERDDLAEAIFTFFFGYLELAGIIVLLLVIGAFLISFKKRGQRKKFIKFSSLIIFSGILACIIIFMINKFYITSPNIIN